MHFDADRLALLAGMAPDTQGLISEGADVVTEASHDECPDGQVWDKEEEKCVDEPVDESPKSHIAKDLDESEDLDEIVEIDENMLRREIVRMRQTRLAESKIRNVIRKEIESILSEDSDDDDDDDVDLYLTSDWLYGKNKPRNSKIGSVATMIPGLGFKAN